jgi:hypothetical protein
MVSVLYPQRAVINEVDGRQQVSLLPRHCLSRDLTVALDGFFYRICDRLEFDLKLFTTRLDPLGYQRLICWISQGIVAYSM